MKNCQIHKKEPWTKCSFPSIPDDPEGLCILHCQNKHKNKEIFDAAVMEKLKKKDYEFWAVFFPWSTKFFSGFKFSKPAIFAEAYFSEADFSGAIFSGRADFRKAIFGLSADFKGASFFDEAYFAGLLLTKIPNSSGQHF